ncbi:unnamed protein product [Meloidogyne enterolobii]|uniref:Uncharacterized protein n=1 Tax=Meloidogyne enterolobii TaxID=390850 RepID=A0ACB1AD50_MELEN
MPVTITAGENRKIRFFDNNTGKIICSTMAHVEGVSTLAIDPNGLYMLSASHDGSVRFWNAEKKICLQKFGSGVMAVAFHPSRQMIGSAGADGLAKVGGKFVYLILVEFPLIFHLVSEIKENPVKINKNK